MLFRSILINLSSKVIAIVFGIALIVEFLIGTELTREVCACAGKGDINAITAEIAAIFWRIVSAYQQGKIADCEREDLLC